MADQELKILEAMWTLGDPKLKKLIRISTANTYEKFVNCIHDEIDECYSFLSRNKNLYKDFSEDQLTGIIVDKLRENFIAHHDASINGHVDFSVEKNNFLWLGEAKIYKGPAYMLEGFYQLNTRYATGEHSASCGGILIYKKIKKKVTLIMAEWEETLTKQSSIDPENLTNLTFTSCEKSKFCTFSTHEHPSVGSDLKVRHMPLDLYFEPQDGEKVPKKT